jgi:prepilin-type N-terminal cleavage/methylation domain-containing protein
MRRGGNSGFTLVEIILALAIIGIALVAVFAGLTVFFKTVVVQRSTADVDQVARTFTEQLQVANYIVCAAPWSTTYGSGATPVTLPAGYSFASAPTINYWTGGGVAIAGASTTTTVPQQFSGSCAHTVAGGATVSGSTTVTSTTANAFSGTDIGANIRAAGIPAKTTIASVQSGTAVTLSQPASATASGLTLTVGDFGAQQISAQIRKDATGVTQQVTVVKRQAG